MKNNDDYDKSLKNSTVTNRVKKKYKLNKFRLTFTTISIAAILFTSKTMVTDIKQKYDDTELINEIVYENFDEFNENKKRSSSNLSNVYYENDKNAEIIIDNLEGMNNPTSTDLNIEIYKMYSNMYSSSQRNEIPNMNELFLYLKRSDDPVFEQLPASFTDYIEELGFVDEENIIDLKEYRSAMKDLILKVEKAKDAKLDINKGVK